MSRPFSSVPTPVGQDEAPGVPATPGATHSRLKNTDDRLRERFLNLPRNENGCWLWQGVTQYRNGYGQVRYNGRKRSVHRISYALFVGPIPDDQELDHLCKVRHCVNPDHLEPVDKRTNWLRSDNFMVWQMDQKLCKRGHDLADAYVKKDGGRQCMICNHMTPEERRKTHSHAQGPCWVIRHDAVIVVQTKHFTYAIDTGGDNRWWYSSLERPNERHLVTWHEVLAWLNAEAKIVNADVSPGRPFTVVVSR